jgi:hypothetical protein
MGPQNTLLDSGIMAKMAVPAVSRMGRARRTVASITASQALWPAARSWSI